jgi:hypothetical protein
MVKSPIEARHAAIRGVCAGLAAGVVLTLMMVGMSAAGGKDVWYAIKGAAAPFLGERAMQPGFDLPAVALGLVDHLAISAIWGVFFALLIFGASRMATAVAGTLWGFVVWIGMYYVALPVVGLSSMQHDAPVGRAIGFHLFFSIAMTTAFLLFPRAWDKEVQGHGRLRPSAHVI